MKNYVYPKLAKNDFWLLNINSSGLGNLLYMYARALIYAKKNNLEIIWPTWFSIQLDRILKLKKDKRSYCDLFINRSGYISGWRKIFLLATKKKMLITKVIPNNIDNYKNTIFVFWGYYGKPLENILYDSNILFEDIRQNLHKKNMNVFNYNYYNKIGVHVRLDDFRTKDTNDIPLDVNCRIPIQWYVNTLKKIKCIIPHNVSVDIYSDGTDEELKELLTLKNVTRQTFGTAIGDMLALSQYKLLIGSGSTFSVLARYLGRMDSISPTGQIREHVLTKNDQSLEIELGFDENIPDAFSKRLRVFFQGKAS